MQKSVKKGKISPFIRPRKLNPNCWIMFSMNQQLGAQKQDQWLGLKAFPKIQINGRDLEEKNVAYPNDERCATQALKVLDPNPGTTS